ncbi:MAG: hypothetical protein AAFP19_12495 [Bacteroidota bacterium]
MASGFWYLKDGRGFAIRIQGMVAILEEIVDELRLDADAQALAKYLSQYLPTEDHEYNGYGGFYHKTSGENTMMALDFREWTPSNQAYFWQAAQRRLTAIIVARPNEEWLIDTLKILLDMHKRANKGEDPMQLNHLNSIVPPTGKKSGPGWETSI